MTAIATSSFRLSNVNNFIADLSVSSYYAFIGRPMSWINDNSPDTPYDNYDSNYLSGWSDIMALKHINSSDVVPGIERYNWVSGTFYAMYDDKISPTNLTVDGFNNLFNSKFYVLTSDSNVYKCINNNGAIASTIMPTGIGSSMITTADGYVWKFMYTVSAPDFQKFATDQHIGIKYSSTSPATSGKIDVISITSGGTGYTSPTVQILGDGTGATATLTVGAGVITAVTITNGGSGYTRARCVITGTHTAAATLRVIIPPIGGHGADPKSELGAFYSLVSVQFRYDEFGKFPVANDYRRIGIIKNPYLYGTTTVATAQQLNATKSLTLSSGVTGTFVPDEIITGGSSSKTGYVVSYDATSRIISYIQTVNELIGGFTIGETITGGTSSASGVLATSGYTPPDVAYGSGSVIYIEHRRPINRAIDQIESLVLAIKF